MKKDDNFHQNFSHSEIKTGENQSKLDLVFYTLEKEMAKAKSLPKPINVVGKLGVNSFGVADASNLICNSSGAMMLQGLRNENFPETERHKVCWLHIHCMVVS